MEQYMLAHQTLTLLVVLIALAVAWAVWRFRPWFWDGFINEASLTLEQVADARPIAMTFVQAIVAISSHPFLELCPNEDEHNGVAIPNNGAPLPICVYDSRNGDFVGKLRWPWMGTEAHVDEQVLSLLRIY